MRNILAALLLLALLAGCSPAQGAEPSLPESSGSPAAVVASQPEPEAEPEPEQIPLSPLRDDPADLDLTRMQEDFDYLWLAMERGYPFLGVAERSGIDVSEIRQRYRDGLESVEDHAAFARHLNQMVQEFGFIGHFEFLGSASRYLAYCEGYRQEENGHTGLLGAQLRQARTVAAYRHLAELEGVPFDTERQYVPGVGASGGSGNLRTQLLDGGNIAYLSINSFRWELVEQDKDALLQFYGEISGCDHLIIDITGNSGGSDNYWQDTIVAPNIATTLTGHQYMLFNYASPENRPYLDSTAGAFGEILPISQLPNLPALNGADKATMDSFLDDETTVHPLGDKPLFDGEIWVLVGPKVYSASESFALFCKDTGFATLVGEGTGGDGGGWDPAFVTLPHSGLVARYSVFYTINPDGGNNEEFGTQPDIPSQPGESALDACLRVIREGA